MQSQLPASQLKRAYKDHLEKNLGDSDCSLPEVFQNFQEKNHPKLFEWSYPQTGNKLTQKYNLIVRSKDHANVTGIITVELNKKRNAGLRRMWYAQKQEGQPQRNCTTRCQLSTAATLYDKLHVQGGPTNETTLVRPTAATVQDKIKRISLKCFQRLRK